MPTANSKFLLHDYEILKCGYYGYDLLAQAISGEYFVITNTRLIGFILGPGDHVVFNSPIINDWQIFTLFDVQSVYTPNMQTPLRHAVDILWLTDTKINRKGENLAYAYVNDRFQYIFPAETLIAFWGSNAEPSEQSAYEFMNIPADASQEEIKKSYRALARQYHPDVGGDTAKFQQLGEFYETLSNPLSRARYDLGLDFFLQSVKINKDAYVPRMRCGHVAMEVHKAMSVFYVNKILEWNPIVRAGKTLVTNFDGHTILSEWI